MHGETRVLHSVVGKTLALATRGLVLSLFGALGLLCTENARAQSSTGSDCARDAAAASDEPKTAEYSYEALSRPVRYRSTQTTSNTIYEERVVTYSEPQTVNRTVREDRGSWEMRPAGLFGLRTKRVWVPRIVESQVSDVVQVERQRVERVPHEVKQETATTVAETVVVQSRRHMPQQSTSTTAPDRVATNSSDSLR